MPYQVTLALQSVRDRPDHVRASIATLSSARVESHCTLALESSPERRASPRTDQHPFDPAEAPASVGTLGSVTRPSGDARDIWALTSILAAVILVPVTLGMLMVGLDRDDTDWLVYAALLPVSGVVFALVSGRWLRERATVRFMFAAPVIAVVAVTSIWLSQRPSSAGVDLPDESVWPSGLSELARATEIVEMSGSGSHGPGWEEHYVALEISADRDLLTTCEQLLVTLGSFGYRAGDPQRDSCNTWGTVGEDGGFSLSMFDDVDTDTAINDAPPDWRGRWKDLRGRVVVLSVS